MRLSKNIQIILAYLEELYPNAYCELNYNKDYELLIAIVLSAQTTDKKVNKVTKVLFNKYKTIEELNKATLNDLEKIIKEIGTYKKKSIYIKDITNKLITDYNSQVPSDPQKLKTLKGVGRKTINVFLAEYYQVPAIAVDTHVERVSKRLNLASINDKPQEIEKKLNKIIPKKYWIQTHHRMIFFGRYHCKAINPKCKDCKLKEICKYYHNNI